MKVSKQMLQAGIGILLLALSLPLSFYASRGYSQERYVVDAASCRMNVLAIQKADVPELEAPGVSEAGSVVLFHGIAANATIMQYVARAFAEMNLRVFIPDLPGHGHSPGPFGPADAENCAASLLRGLAARGMIDPQRTILAGHSMGAAIALRVAEKFRPAGVIAISPAPMDTAQGIAPQNLLFHGLPKPVPNTRILVGQFEPFGIHATAAALVASAHDPSVAYLAVRHNTHVSMIFSPAVARESQQWAAHVLKIPEATRVPSRANLLAAILGLIGIILVAGPFLRDVLGKNAPVETAIHSATPRWRGVVEVIVISLAAVLLLRYWMPLRFVRLFEGDYLASFFLIVGLILMALHYRATRQQFPVSRAFLIGAAISGFLLHFLITSWFELTVTSAWLTLQRWVRFPTFLVCAFVFLYALELLAGRVMGRAWLRYIFWLLLVALAWHSLAFAVFHLKNGEILLVLLVPFFALQFILLGLGIQLVRRLTGSVTAAVLFGAILLAGFCLALFPVT